MRRRLHFGSSGRGPHDPWFRIGTLDVNTTVLVTILSGFFVVAFAFDPFPDKPMASALALDPNAVLHGQVWRVLTWPFSYPAVSLWDILTVAIFWYFGRDIEDNLLGRKRMAQFLVGCTLILGLLLVGMAALWPITGQLSGLAQLELMVLLAWIAEWPQRRFLFNIPAWVFGLVIVGLSVVQMMGTGGWVQLLQFLLGIGLCALLARSLGMLAEHHALPKLSMPHRSHKPKKSKRKFSGPTVVSGPWAAQQAPQGYPSSQPAPSRDEARMDALLDKIHAEGQDALTAKEKAELLELRERMRRRP